MNLLEETIEYLRENGKELSDIRWFGSYSFKASGDIADVFNVDYNNGYGGQEIAQDLIVAGDDWWLERHEYDGSEWWEYKSKPNTPKCEVDIKKVKGFGSDSLREINNEDEES